MDWSPKKRKRDDSTGDDLSPQAKRGRTDSSSEDSRSSSGSPVSGEEYNAKPQFLDDKTCVQIRDEIYRIGDCVWLHRDQAYTSVVHRGTGTEDTYKYNWMAKIVGFEADKDDPRVPMMRVSWFWQVKETILGNGRGWSNREVFMSTNEVLQDAEVIKGRCTVLYKKEFDDDYVDSLPPDTYVYRYCYDPKTTDFLDPPFVEKNPQPKAEEGERLRALDVFSGCGGFSFGMSNAGIDINWAVDKEKDMIKTFRKTHPDTHAYVADVKDFFSLALFVNESILPGSKEEYKFFKSIEEVRSEVWTQYDVELSPDVYLVEDIRDCRWSKKRKRIEFRIKWEGWPEEENSWEPIENINNLSSIKRFLKNNREKYFAVEQQKLIEHGVIKSPEDMPMKEPFIPIDGSELSAEARKQLKKIKKLTRRGLLYDKNYTKRKKERHDDLSEDSDSEENHLIVQSQSQATAAQGMRSDSFDDEFFDEDFIDADEADDIDVRPVKTIERVLDMRYIEGKAQYFVKWQHQPDCAGEWCFLKKNDAAVRKYYSLSAAKKQELKRRRKQINESIDSISDIRAKKVEMIDGRKKRVIEFKVHFSQRPDVEKWMRREELYHVQHLLDEFVANKRCDGSLPTVDTCDILIGGPPCQGFSVMNNMRYVLSQNDVFKDKRNRLIKIWARYVLYFKPRFAVLENVSGLLSFFNGSAIKSLLKVLLRHGYQTRVRMVNTAQYGLPQSRWRVFLFAARQGEWMPRLPKPTHFVESKVHHDIEVPPPPLSDVWKGIANLAASHSRNDNIYHVRDFDDYIKVKPEFEKVCPERECPTIEDAIGDLPDEAVDKFHDDHDRPVQYLCDPLNMFQHCMRLLPPEDQTRSAKKDEEDRIMTRVTMHIAQPYAERERRYTWDDIFGTLTTRGYVNHPCGRRSISLREAARAQGFPDWIEFEGGFSSKMTQIGNAVPVFVADQIGQAIVSAAETNTCMQPTPFAILLQSDHIDPVTKLPVYN